MSSARLRACNSQGETNVETELGSLMADAACRYTGAQIGLLPSADFGTNLQEGAITESVLEQCLQNNSVLTVVELTPETLFQFLEQGISHLTLNRDSMIDWAASHYDGYLQISGIYVVYDAASPTGERVWSVKLTDGTELNRTDCDTVLQVVMTAGMAQGAYGYPRISTDPIGAGTERDALRSYIQEQGTVDPPDGQRTELKGTRNWVISARTPLLVIAVMAGVVFARITTLQRRKKKASPYGFDPDRSL